jgi:hypothetical protein
MTDYTETEIRARITTNPRWTERAILAVYEYQTDVEQVKKETVENNGVGFNGLDAPFLSSLAQWLQKGHHLTERQLKPAQKMIGKYAGQLKRIARPRPEASYVFDRAQLMQSKIGSDLILCQEASCLAGWNAQAHTTMDDYNYELTGIDKTDEGEITKWKYTCEDHNARTLIIDVFND